MSSENLKEMPDYVRKQIMDAYPIFREKLSSKDFLTRMVILGGKEGGNYLRASLSFQQSQKCRICNKNVAMALLCSAVEAMRPKDGQIQFKDWLVKNRLDDLEKKSKKELKTAIKAAYDDFLTVPDREGAWYNFKEFIVKNCPEKLQTVPNILSQDILIKQAVPKVISRNIPFEDALKIIYGEFRSYYLHRALPQFDKIKQRPFIFTRTHRFLPKYSTAIDLNKFLEWFSNVVKESLYTYFIYKTS